MPIDGAEAARSGEWAQHFQMLLVYRKGTVSGVDCGDTNDADLSCLSDINQSKVSLRLKLCFPHHGHWQLITSYDSLERT